MTLNELHNGKIAIISQLSGPQNTVERLTEMGFHCGVELLIRGRSPLGGPLIVQVGKSYIAVRPEEALCIILRED